MKNNAKSKDLKTIYNQNSVDFISNDEHRRSYDEHSADTPVDTGLSRSNDRTELENLKRRSKVTLNEIELLKVNNENMRAKLLGNMMNNSYMEEIGKLKSRSSILQHLPCSLPVSWRSKQYGLIRQHGNNQEVMTRIPPALYETEPECELA